MRIPVLMYHAVGQVDAAAGADAHYAVPRPAFREQLGCIVERGLAISSVAAILDAPNASPRIALTFDDGDESNALAAIDIAEHGGSADFFVNPAHVGKRGFLDWAALRDLSRQGFSVQSHGQTHRYLNELDDAQVAEELRISKAEIEDGIGKPVTLFAPPGGRLTASVPRIAASLGYRAMCSSRVGVWRADADPWNIPRLAVLAGTDRRRFERWIRQDWREMTRLQVRHAVLAGMKGVLGNRAYERLRAGALGARAGSQG